MCSSYRTDSPKAQAAILAKQFVERGLDKSGIKLIGPGDIADDEDLPGMSEAMVGMVTAASIPPITLRR
jgi:branched-chain amino acid transport system substrate-binding protein